MGVEIPRRAEIAALIETGASNGAIAVALRLPHAEVARVRKIMRSAAAAAARKAAGLPRPALSAKSREKKQAADRARSAERPKRHDVRAVAMAEESLYRKRSMMRRARVLEMLAEGKTPTEIASALAVNSTTVHEIIASLEGRRGWRRQASVTVLMDPDTRDRIRQLAGKRGISAWILRLIDTEIARLDAP